MGVPTFYRWLSLRYPKVIRDVVQEDSVIATSGSGEDEETVFVPADLTTTNPNGIEFDNLYLDMNGIIHPCCHGDDCTPAVNEDEMILNVFAYIERIVGIVRPRQLLFLAIDGVAPRAKMNQQRMRRFRAACDVAIQNEIYEELSAKFASEGRNFPGQKSSWDSNVITPGTPFMDNVAAGLRHFIGKKMSEDTYWSGLKVLLSDSNVPGEGEHKIVAFIRSQRMSPKYDPNLVHCLHGMDADLIMLGLATHEAHFYIIREIVSELPKKESHEPVTGGGCAEDTSFAGSSSDIVSNAAFRSTWKPLQFLCLPVLREYLELQFTFDNHTNVLAEEVKIQRSDFERHLDDFILLCFFVGNDFLPHLPSLSIHKGSIDMLICLYCMVYPRLGDYLTCHGKINKEPLRKFLTYVNNVEPEVLTADREREKAYKRRREAEKMSTNNNSLNSPIPIPPTEQVKETPFNPGTKRGRGETSVSSRGAGDDDGLSELSDGSEASSTMAKRRRVISLYSENIDMFKELLKQKLKGKTELSAEDESLNDEINLGEGEFTDYRFKYYIKKFHMNNDDDDVEYMSCRVAQEYLLGMRWVLEYYFQGPPSWSWYYPFHYAPFAYDFIKYGFSDTSIAFTTQFQQSTPFSPFCQLLAVLPPASARICLPKGYANLMTDPTSIVGDFYPETFTEDPDGKRFKWQWVTLLPFIDETRLLSAVKQVQSTRTSNEILRDSLGQNILFVSNAHREFQVFEKGSLSVSSVQIDQSNLCASISKLHIEDHILTAMETRKCSQLPFLEPFSSMCITVAVSMDSADHRSCLLTNSTPPIKTVQLEDLQDSNFQSSNRRFGGAAAKRMIIATVSRIHEGDHIGTGIDNNPFYVYDVGRQYGNYNSSGGRWYEGGNAYSQRTMYTSIPHEPYQPWARQGPEPPPQPQQRPHIWQKNRSSEDGSYDYQYQHKQNAANFQPAGRWSDPYGNIHTPVRGSFPPQLYNEVNRPPPPPQYQKSHYVEMLRQTSPPPQHSRGYSAHNSNINNSPSGQRHHDNHSNRGGSHNNYSRARKQY